MFGGDCYLDGYSIYDSPNGYKHMVTFGMTELYADEPFQFIAGRRKPRSVRGHDIFKPEFQQIHTEPLSLHIDRGRTLWKYFSA